MDYAALVLLDGDGQHTPRDVPPLVKAVVDEDADLVVGSRYLDRLSDDETPFYRRCGQYVLDRLTATVSKTQISDSQSGFRAFSPTAVDKLSLQASGYSIESEMIQEAVKADLQMTEQPVTVRYDEVDGQTDNPVRHGLFVTWFLIRQLTHRYWTSENHPRIGLVSGFVLLISLLIPVVYEIALPSWLLPLGVFFLALNGLILLAKVSR
jgi:glycosyltransferase involved in cell wall biosynthesis